MAHAEAELALAEAALRTAMLASQLEALDALMADDLLFIGPEGALLSKADDLGFYRTGVQRMTAIDLEERQARVGTHTAAVSTLARVTGVFNGRSFQGRFRYLRVWHRSSTGWKLLAGSVSRLDSPLSAQP